MQNDVKIVHFVPGRVRFRTQEVKRSPEFTHKVESRLRDIKGVQRVEVNQLTGSVLVTYNPETIADPENLKAISDAVHTLFPSLDIEKLKQYL